MDRGFNSRNTPCTKKRVLAWAFGILQIALFFSFLLSLAVVMTSEGLRFDLSVNGLKTAVDLFSVPLACVAALFAVLTLDVAVKELEESALQRATATWESVQNSFIAYAKDQAKLAKLPFSVFASQPFGERYRASDFDGPMFDIQYHAPTITLRRLLDSSTRFETVHFSLHPTLGEQLSHLESLFNQLCVRAGQGNEQWLAAFVDAALLIRQIREYLVVETERMSDWVCQPILQEREEFGAKRRLPPYASLTISGISIDIRTELLCIASVLLFAPAGEHSASKLVNMAVRIGLLWSHASVDLKSLFDENNLDKIWDEPYLMANAKINI